MFASVFAATINLLTFRKGPQDFPYSTTLMPWTMGFAAIANLAVFAQVIPLPLAVLMALAMVFGMALVTRVLLRTRGLEERYNQTLNSLLVTGGLLTLALAPLFASVSPLLRELASNPELMNQPDKLKFPQGTMFLMNLLNFWNFAVTSSIYRQAANVHLAFGILIALIAALSVMLFVILFASLLGGLLGLNAS